MSRTLRTSFRLIVIAAVAVLLVLPAAARAQDEETGGAPAGGQRGGRGEFAGMQRAGGEVTAVAGNTITIKTEAGDTMQVVTTDNTRVMKGRGETVKVADLKPGDGVTAAGNLDAPNKTLHAAIVFVVDAAQLKAMKDNLGKTYIVGKVTSIDLDNAKMTVERPDHVSQTIGFDEGTSFRRGRVNMGGMGGGMYGGGGRPGGGAGRTAPNGPPQGESITLADIKVGDEVGGRGEMKNGVFVPAELSVATPGQRRRRPEGGPGVGGDAPGTPGAPSEPNPPAR